MRTRGDDLRRRHNRILFWSVGIAAVLHATLFLLWPTMTVEVPASTDTRFEPPGAIVGVTVMVDVTFGPPRINQADGGISVEPPERFLETTRIMSLPTGCETLLEQERIPAQGQVRLQVVASGRTRVEAIEMSTGDECADQVILTLANDLLYRWIPSARFPAPVDLVQPVTLTQATS